MREAGKGIEGRGKDGRAREGEESTFLYVSWSVG